MDILLKDIFDRLKTIEDFKWIDEDNGQLENPPDNYPIQFPCAFVSFEPVNWENIGQQVQEGDVMINIRIAFDIYEDTHTVPEQICINEDYNPRNLALARLQLLNTVHATMQAFEGANYNKLDRRRSSPEKREDDLKVITLSYMTRLTDGNGRKQATAVNDVTHKLTVSFG